MTQKTCFTRKKSVKNIDHIRPVTEPIVKPIISEIVPKHVNHVPSTEHAIEVPLKFVDLIFPGGTVDIVNISEPPFD